jgi:hypothetical protein
MVTVADLERETVDARFTNGTIEVFRKGNGLAPGLLPIR